MVSRLSRLCAVTGYTGPLETELVPDEHVMAQFLTWWFEKCNLGAIEICWRCRHTGRLDLVRRFALDNINEAARFAAETNALPGCSVYFRPATVRFESLNTTDTDIVQIPGAWGDYDTPEAVGQLRAVQCPRPSAEVVTGRIPDLRTQAFWKTAGDPILIGDWVRTLNRQVRALTGGDPAVVNPSSLMRLPGTIAWPWKDGREPELTEWVTPDGGGGTFTLDALRAALPAIEAEPLANGHAAGDSTTELLNPTLAMVEQARRGDHWNNAMLSATARMVAKGYPDWMILALAEHVTLPGYRVEDTRKELADMAARARKKGFAPDDPADADSDETAEAIIADVMDVPPKDAPEPTPEIIDGDWWLTRDLTRPVPVLGEVICTSTRVMIGGPTGVGKTHLATGMASAIATGNGFLHWSGPAEPLAVLYIDGEMARDLIQDRMRDLQRRLGGASLANLHMLCREDFPAMQGLNTLPGRTFVLAAVEHLKPSVIFLDSRMCLLVGDMKDEVPWTETMPLVWALTRRQVAQVWLDHTGHDSSHIYGSKTKEWQLDLVGLLGEVSDPHADLAIRLEWKKARRRRPETKADFAPGIVTLSDDAWLWTPDENDAGGKGKRGRGMSDETELLRRAIYTLALDPNVGTTFVSGISFPVRAIGVVTTIAYLITNAWLTETVDYAGEGIGGVYSLTKRGRDRLRNSLNTLKRNGICGFNKDFVWPAKHR